MSGSETISVSTLNYCRKSSLTLQPRTNEDIKWRPSEGNSQASQKQMTLIKSEEPLNSMPINMNEKPLKHPEWRPLNDSDIDGLQSFLFFIGWPRSCHSVIGSMLDAHPNIIVAHEFFLFKKIRKDEQLRDRNKLFNELYSNSYRNAINGWRSDKNTIKGYNFRMAGSWQGQFSKLKVIGDKSGGDSVAQFRTGGREFYEQFKKDVKLPIKILQVIRNPFDAIATDVLYHATDHHGKFAATPTNKYTDFKSLKNIIRNFIRLTNTLISMETDLNQSPHQVYCDDLVADPIKTISGICDYLEVECSAEYLQMCADKTYKKVSMSRDLVTWDPKTLPSLMKDLEKFPYFARYL